MQYATEDVAYNDPGTPPIAMTFAALGHFFSDSSALGDMTAKKQQTFIERISPPLGRHITWTDFKIILELVAERRFPRLQQDLATRQTLEDILLNLQLSPTQTGSPSAAAAPPAVLADNLYQELLIDSGTKAAENRPAGDSDEEYETNASLSWQRGITAGGANHHRHRLPSDSSAHGHRRITERDDPAKVAKRSESFRSASKVTAAASDAATSKRSAKTASSSRVSALSYMPRAIYAVADPVLSFLGNGHSGEDMCRRIHLPLNAASPFDEMTSELLVGCTPAQRLWMAIAKAAPLVFPNSAPVAAEELTFQILYERAPSLLQP